MRGVVGALIIAALVLAVGLIVLGLTGDFLVDWLWFSAIGYLSVFWTTIGAKTAVFFAVLVPTTVMQWVNGLLACRLGGSTATQPATRLAWTRPGAMTTPDLLEYLRHRLP